MNWHKPDICVRLAHRSRKSVTSIQNQHQALLQAAPFSYRLRECCLRLYLAKVESWSAYSWVCFFSIVFVRLLLDLACDPRQHIFIIDTVPLRECSSILWWRGTWIISSLRLLKVLLL